MLHVFMFETPEMSAVIYGRPSPLGSCEKGSLLLGILASEIVYLR